jgi:hypothetical protein
MNQSVIDGVRPRRGRPRKFSAPSRAVTLTLPEDVVAALVALDPDLSRAVARLAQPLASGQPHEPAELSVFGRRAVIVVRPSRRLERQIGVELVPLPDGRALIAFDRLMTIPQMELLLRDAADRHELPADDQQIFEAIAAILRAARQSGRVTLHQRHIIVLEATRGTLAPSARPPKAGRTPSKRPGPAGARPITPSPRRRRGEP